MDDFVSETDSEYTSYWRDWVCSCFVSLYRLVLWGKGRGEKKNTCEMRNAMRLTSYVPCL